MAQITLMDFANGTTAKVNGYTNGTPQGAILGGSQDVVPKEHTARTLVMCFDGTGDQFDADVSHFGTCVCSGFCPGGRVAVICLGLSY